MAGRKQMLEFKANIIEDVMRQNRVDVQVTGATLTPGFIRFKLAPAPTTRIRKV